MLTVITDGLDTRQGFGLCAGCGSFGDEQEWTDYPRTVEFNHRDRFMDHDL